MSDQEDDMPSLYHLEEEEDEDEDIDIEDDYDGHFGEEEEEEEDEQEADEGDGDDEQQGDDEGNEEGEEEEVFHDDDPGEGNQDDMLEDLLETMLDGDKGGQKQVTEERPVSGSKMEIENDHDANRREKELEEDGATAGGMVDYLQQFDETYTTFPRDPIDGTIKVDELSIEQRKIYNAKVMSLLTENQMDRYECFRRSSLKEPMRRLVQMVVGGGQPKNTDKIVIAMSGVAKVFVGELIEESRRIADARGNLGALSKEDVCEAYFRISSSSRELRQTHGKKMRL